MNGSVAIDVAIGLVLMFLVLSMFCTIIQEWIAQIWNWRAKNLEAAIIHLLNGSRFEKSSTEAQGGLIKRLIGSRADKGASVANASDQAKDVLNHPLVKMLAPGKDAGITSGKDKPSYVTATNFALALIDVLKPDRSADGKVDFKGLQDAVKKLGDINPELQKSLQPILDAADGKVSDAITGIETWFDSAMDRASGWYKRNVSVWLIWMGLFLATVTNADTIQARMRLSADSDMRAAVAAYAQTVAPPGEKTPATPVAPPVQTPPVQTPPAAAAAPPGGKPPAAPEKSADAQIKKFHDDLAAQLESRNLTSGFGGLPIGWTLCYKGTDDKTAAQPDDKDQTHFSLGACYGEKGGILNTSWPVALLAKIIGLCLTGLMASLGSPFWFGLLQQLNAVRSTGPRPVANK